jgi:hypothetical protein
MRVWLACFVLLFALAELFDWLKDFSLPLPIYILGGAFLAVASNYDKIVGYYFSETSITASTASLETPQLDAASPPLASISSSIEDAQKSEKQV